MSLLHLTYFQLGVVLSIVIVLMALLGVIVYQLVVSIKATRKHEKSALPELGLTLGELPDLDESLTEKKSAFGKANLDLKDIE